MKQRFASACAGGQPWTGVRLHEVEPRCEQRQPQPPSFAQLHRTWRLARRLRDYFALLVCTGSSQAGGVPRR